MIEKNEWLEFELLADANIRHGVLFHHQVDVPVCVPVPLPDLVQHVKLQHFAEFGHGHGHAHGHDVISCKQVHGKEVFRVTSEKDTPTCDALSTNIPHLSLMIRHADCQAAIFYDPIHHAVANVHSGWRGSVQNIYAETISHMKVHYGTNPQDLLVAISPSLGPKSAEFIHYREEFPEPFWHFQIKENTFDFWAISRWQLTQSGVLPHHIQIAEIDTYTDPRFFSYRRDRTDKRNGTFVIL